MKRIFTIVVFLVVSAMCYAQGIKITLPATSVNSIQLNPPGVLYSTPVNFTITGRQAIGTLSLISQSQNLILASPNGSSGAPSFRQLVVGDINATGAPSSATYLRGDGVWATAGFSGDSVKLTNANSSGYLYYDYNNGPYNRFRLVSASGVVPIFDISGTSSNTGGALFQQHGIGAVGSTNQEAFSIISNNLLGLSGTQAVTFNTVKTGTGVTRPILMQPGGTNNTVFYTNGNRRTFGNDTIANVFALTYVKSGGTSGQFLKADGSSDATAYLPITSSSAAQVGSFSIGGSPVSSQAFSFTGTNANGLDNITFGTATANGNGIYAVFGPYNSAVGGDRSAQVNITNSSASNYAKFRTAILGGLTAEWGVGGSSTGLFTNAAYITTFSTQHILLAPNVSTMVDVSTTGVTVSGTITSSGNTITGKTESAGDNSTKLASTAFVQGEKTNFVVAQNDLAAQSSAGNITTFTVGAVTKQFDISGYINITAVSADVIQLQVTYTDQNSNAQTISFTTLNSISDSAYSPITIRAKNGTVITVKTNLTTGVGSITFDAGCSIVQK